jgi:hypothetical protein
MHKVIRSATCRVHSACYGAWAVRQICWWLCLLAGWYSFRMASEACYGTRYLAAQPFAALLHSSVAN